MFPSLPPQVQGVRVNSTEGFAPVLIAEGWSQRKEVVGRRGKGHVIVVWTSEGWKARGRAGLSPASRNSHTMEGGRDTCQVRGYPLGIQHCCLFSCSCLTLCDPVDCSMQAFPSFTISLSLLKLMSIESMMPSRYLILCHPFRLLPWIFPNIRVFSNESALYIRWPKYWSFSFSISPSHEDSGLISFSIDWFDLLAVQGSLKSLLQYHCLKASILQHSAFFMVQLSHLAKHQLQLL